MLRVISPHLIVAASVAVAGTALLPRGADAAVYLNGSAHIPVDQSQGVLATAVNVNTTVSVARTNSTPYNAPAPDTCKSSIAATVDC